MLTLSQEFQRDVKALNPYDIRQVDIFLDNFSKALNLNPKKADVNLLAHKFCQTYIPPIIRDCSKKDITRIIDKLFAIRTIYCNEINANALTFVDTRFDLITENLIRILLESGIVIEKQEDVNDYLDERLNFARFEAKSQDQEEAKEEKRIHDAKTAQHQPIIFQAKILYDKQVLAEQKKIGPSSIEAIKVIRHLIEYHQKICDRFGGFKGQTELRKSSEILIFELKANLTKLFYFALSNVKDPKANINFPYKLILNYFNDLYGLLGQEKVNINLFNKCNENLARQLKDIKLPPQLRDLIDTTQKVVTNFMEKNRDYLSFAMDFEFINENASEIQKFFNKYFSSSINCVSTLTDKVDISREKQAFFDHYFQLHLDQLGSFGDSLIQKLFYIGEVYKGTIAGSLFEEMLQRVLIKKLESKISTTNTLRKGEGKPELSKDEIEALKAEILKKAQLELKPKIQRLSHTDVSTNDFGIVLDNLERAPQTPLTQQVLFPLKEVKKELETQMRIDAAGTATNSSNLYLMLGKHFARLTGLISSADFTNTHTTNKIQVEITAIQNICDGKGTTKVTYTEYVPPIPSSLKETITSALTVIATAVFFAAVGAAIGFLVGGPIGAGAGATVGVYHALIGGTIGVSAFGLFKIVQSFFAPYELTDPIVTNVNQKISAPPKALKDTVTATLEQVNNRLETASTASTASSASVSRRGSMSDEEQESHSPRFGRSGSFSE